VEPNAASGNATKLLRDASPLGDYIVVRVDTCRREIGPEHVQTKSFVNTIVLNRLIVLLLLIAICAPIWAQEKPHLDAAPENQPADHTADDTQSNILAPEEWQRLDAAVDRALVWLAAQQQPDGSFPTMENGQPGVTSLCVLAFMAHGHLPGEGEYGRVLERATQFILSCQKRNGLVSLYGPEGVELSRDIDETLGVTGAYNHAISSLTLSEIYGVQTDRSESMQQAIAKALSVTLEMQRWPKVRPEDMGGWRYLTYKPEGESDLSVTGWQLMFLRSARNAGFNVPKQVIDDAVAYVRRTYDLEQRRFRYLTGKSRYGSRATAGAGILALAHAGFHNSDEAKNSGQWLLKHDFVEYNGNSGIKLDRYHYSLFNACQAMYQLGGSYWEQFFPPTVHALLAAQAADGSWEAESYQRDRPYGKSYTTSLVVLSLGAPNQFLPVFQR
jgi:hypothetical protein